MAFHETRLPDEIERGALGGPRFKTTVIELSSGFERRNIDWSLARGEWDIGYGLMSLDDTTQSTYIDLVRQFFYAREGRAHGFRFKDWSDFELARSIIGLTDGSNATFQIFKRYTSGSVDYDRSLTKIVTGTESVWVNNVAITEGAGVSQYQLNDNTGVITLGSTLAAQSGTNVEVQCEFDVPVRFDDDHLRISMQHAAGTGAASIPGIPIIEIRV